MESEATILRRGDSVGISLPQPLLRQLGFTVGQTVYLQATPDGLLIRARRPRYTAAELNAMCDPSAPMPEDLKDWENIPAAGTEL